MKLIMVELLLKSALKCDSFDVTIGIKIQFFRVSVTVELGHFYYSSLPRSLRSILPFNGELSMVYFAPELTMYLHYSWAREIR